MKSFTCELEGGVLVTFELVEKGRGTIAPKFMLEVRGPGQEGQGEFVGRVGVEVCAHGNVEHFRRYLVLHADCAKPFAYESEGYSFKRGYPTFYPDRVSYLVAMKVGDQKGCDITMPVQGLGSLRLECIEMKPKRE